MAKTARVLPKHPRTEKPSRLVIFPSKPCILLVIHKTVFVGSWKILPEGSSLLGILFSMAVRQFSPSFLHEQMLTSLGCIGCGRFFEGTAAEMHKALNKTLSAVPDDTKVYVSFHVDCSDLPDTD